MTRKRDRQRKLERERRERQMLEQAQHQRKIRHVVLGTVTAVVVAAGFGGAALAGGFSGSGPAAASSPPPSATPSPPPSATSAATPSASTVAEPAHHCTYTPAPPAARKVGTPPSVPDYAANYRAVIHTNRGSIAIALLNSRATCTVNSFVYLAGKKYFSRTPCHRLTTSGIFVLQCGDPTGTGRGGPGYKFADENLAGAKYTAGTVAMANSGPGTNGSQFFLVYKNSPLPPDYTPFGTITRGLNVIQDIAKAGSDNSNGKGDGHPKEKVTIESVTITKT